MTLSSGVPAVTVGIVAFFVIGSSRKGREAKKGSKGSGGGGGPFAFLGGGGGLGGEKPSPFVIKRLNDKLDSYAYAFQAGYGSSTRLNPRLRKLRPSPPPPPQLRMYHHPPHPTSVCTVLKNRATRCRYLSQSAFEVM